MDLKYVLIYCMTNEEHSEVRMHTLGDKHFNIKLLLTCN